MNTRTAAHAFPSPDSNWPLVAAGALMGCVAIGVVFSLAVLLEPMGAASGWSRAGISGAMTLAFLSMGVAGFGWGTLSDRYGPRVVVLAGSVLLGLASVGASRAASLLEFQLFYGVLMGAAAGSFFAPVIAATAASFERHRSLAVSLVSAGMGMGPMTISPLVGWLVTQHDWRTTLLIVGILAWALTLPAVWFVRSAPAAAQAGAGEGGGAPPMTARQALRSKAFIVLAATFFACCAAHSGPIFHTVSYAIGCGLSTVAAVTIYSMEGAAGLGGRLLFGLLADRLGAKPVLVAGLLVQAFAAAAYLLVNQLGGFYAVALVFGMAYGGTMPLYATLAREAFGPRILGTMLGAATLLSSLGMATGPLLGGWLYDRFGSYAWLYLGSLAVGLGAAAIALMFPASRPPTGTLATPARCFPG
ncbi:MFS transporter [Ramlibacter tataouinensis]|uniref:Candidate transporter n=1 Tax=Ramlibacter tataouinensis (strain ATCC BAA-407 / DSM 14655 / LMG 21543 / TTB310) TaxID=365046 RepID=F5XWZ2_RAMTT|nr:MFS transporter [Ramlibacter tataouinensis]AEG91753.1 Candidate transporter [Ramlibacter tataouinensis TTB310]